MAPDVIKVVAINGGTRCAATSGNHDRLGTGTAHQ